MTYKGYNILLISLDNENGALRRKELNYPYTWIKGLYGGDFKNPLVKEVDKRIYLGYNAIKRSKKWLGFVGNMASHLKVLEHIVKNKLNNTITLEDDSILIHPLPNPKTLPDDSPVLFSGQLRHPKSWGKDAEWVETQQKKSC